MSREFIKVQHLLIPVDTIADVDIQMLESGGYVTVHYGVKDGYHSYESITSGSTQEALDLVMRLCPAALEGKRLKTRRRQWAFHNLVAHPTLQILAWAKKTKLGMAIHDASIPKGD